jgi:hypothetical protein
MLFRDALRVQGIQSDRIKLNPTGNDDKLVIYDIVVTHVPRGPANYPLLEAYDINNAASLLRGRAGQGNPSFDFGGHLFGAHFIASSGTGTGMLYYDPSYGRDPKPSLETYENDAFWGYAKDRVARDDIPDTAVRADMLSRGWADLIGFRANNIGTGVGSEISAQIDN